MQRIFFIALFMSGTAFAQNNNELQDAIIKRSTAVVRNLPKCEYVNFSGTEGGGKTPALTFQADRNGCGKKWPAGCMALVKCEGESSQRMVVCDQVSSSACPIASQCAYQNDHGEIGSLYAKPGQTDAATGGKFEFYKGAEVKNGVRVVRTAESEPLCIGYLQVGAKRQFGTGPATCVGETCTCSTQAIEDDQCTVMYNGSQDITGSFVPIRTETVMEDVPFFTAKAGAGGKSAEGKKAQ